MSEASKEKKPEAKQQASQGSLIYHPHGGLATYPSVLGLESTAAAFVALQQRGAAGGTSPKKGSNTTAAPVKPEQLKKQAEDDFWDEFG